MKLIPIFEDKVERIVSDKEIVYKTGVKSYAIILKQDSEWHLQIIESFQEGEGSILMKAIVADAKEARITKITLSSSSERGDYLYEKFGFKKTHKNQIRDGADEYKEIEYTLSIE